MELPFHSRIFDAMQIFRRIIINVVVDVVVCSPSRIDGGADCCKLLSPRSAYCKTTISSSLWNNFMNNLQNLHCILARNIRHRLAMQYTNALKSAHPQILRVCLFYSKTIKTAVTKTFSSWYFLIYALLVCFIKYLLQEVPRSNFGCCSFRSILSIKSVDTSVVNLLQIILRMVSSSRRLSDVKQFVRIGKLSAYQKNRIHFFLLLVRTIVRTERFNRFITHNCTQQQRSESAGNATLSYIYEYFSCLTAAYIVPQQKMLRKPAR